MGNNTVRKNRHHIHTPPSGISRNASFFITINCKERGCNQIAKETHFKIIRDTAIRYTDDKRWLPELLLVMPDHLHAIASFPWGDQKQMSAVIRDFKRFTARACGIQWQRDYFDHRIRNEAEHQAKWRYITDNPVRAGLAGTPQDWTYVWKPPA